MHCKARAGGLTTQFLQGNLRPRRHIPVVVFRQVIVQTAHVILRLHPLEQTRRFVLEQQGGETVTADQRLVECGRRHHSRNLVLCVGVVTVKQ